MFGAFLSLFILDILFFRSRLNFFSFFGIFRYIYRLVSSNMIFFVEIFCYCFFFLVSVPFRRIIYDLYIRITSRIRARQSGQ